MRWVDFYIGFAIDCAKKSNDPHTKCGCVITNADNTILSIGYNGFAKGIDNSKLSTERPEKYKWFIHAEQNAICNAALNGIGLKDGIAYVSSRPCLSCVQLLHQAGINDIYFTDWSKPVMNHTTDDDFTKIVNLMSMKIEFVPLKDLKINGSNSQTK